jgi:hypothetical protein
LANNVTLTLVSPDGTVTESVVCSDVDLSPAEFNEAVTLTATFEHNWTRYGSESSATNPVVMNAYGTLLRGAQYLWRGNVYAVRRQQDGDKYLVTLEANDKLGKLAKTVAGTAASGRHFTQNQVEYDLVDVFLAKGEAEPDAPYPFYVGGAYSGAPYHAWLPHTGAGAAPAIALDANINSAVTDIVAEVDAHDMRLSADRR